MGHRYGYRMGSQPIPQRGAKKNPNGNHQPAAGPKSTPPFLQFELVPNQAPWNGQQGFQIEIICLWVLLGPWCLRIATSNSWWHRVRYQCWLLMSFATIDHQGQSLIIQETILVNDGSWSVDIPIDDRCQVLGSVPIIPFPRLNYAPYWARKLASVEILLTSDLKADV